MLTHRQLAEWHAYHNLEPFGPWRDDVRQAAIRHTIARAFGNKQAKIQDFMLNFRKAHEQTEDDMKSILKARVALSKRRAH